VGNGSYHRIRRTFQQIGKPHQKPAFAQANRIVDVRESKKLNLQLRRRGAGPQLPVFLMKDFDESLAHSQQISTT
jgi:hypothetical protein